LERPALKLLLFTWTIKNNDRSFLATIANLAQIGDYQPYLVKLSCHLAEKSLMKWRVVLELDPETGDWAVWCPELPGCNSAGETEEEALHNIQEAIELYLVAIPPQKESA
jgi:predicted RNase H-like HicB family nuclease